MYVRRGTRWQPVAAADRRRSALGGGTENVAWIVGMGAAAELAVGVTAGFGRGGALNGGAACRLERGILQNIEDTQVIGDSRKKRVANTTNIGFARLEAEAILTLLLSERDICAQCGCGLFQRLARAQPCAASDGH